MRRLLRPVGYAGEAYPSGRRSPRVPSCRQDRLLDHRNPYACDDRSLALQTHHRQRAPDSDDPHDGLPRRRPPARDLKDGVVCSFGGQLIKSIYYGVFVRLSSLVSRLKKIHEFPPALGKVN